MLRRVTTVLLHRKLPYFGKLIQDASLRARKGAALAGVGLERHVGDVDLAPSEANSCVPYQPITKLLSSSADSIPPKRAAVAIQVEVQPHMRTRSLPLNYQKRWLDFLCQLFQKIGKGQQFLRYLLHRRGQLLD